MAIACRPRQAFRQHNGFSSKPWVSSENLNQPVPGRDQEVNAFIIIIVVLSGGNVFGLRTLGAVGNLHGHCLALLKRLVTFGLDRAVMNEYVLSTLL